MRLPLVLVALLAICSTASAQLLPVTPPLTQRALPYGVSIPAVTSSSVSYPGCPGEVTTHTNTWYFDQVNGFTQSNYAAGTGGAPLVTTIGLPNGQGTVTHPWNNLQALTGNNAGTPTSGYTEVLLATAPGGSGSPIVAGDLILVNTGSYGAVNFGGTIVNSPALTIKAGASQVPLLTELSVTQGIGFHLEGLKVQGTGAGNGPLVTVQDNSVAHSTSDIILENMDISSAPVATADTWSRATWITNARPGVMFFSEAGENPSTSITCGSVINSHIYVVSNNSQFGAIEGEAGSLLAQGNEIDHFYPNGIKFYESNYSIGNNYIHDAINTGQGQPIDYALFQGIDSTLDTTLWQSNIYFYRNEAVENADASLPSTFQAALSFYLNSTGDITNFVALDNLISGSGSCAICTGNVHNGVVANNSSMYSGGIGGQNPVMNFTQEHAGAAGFGTGPLGRAPSNVWAFNNIGNIFECLNGLQCYHNISAPGSTGFATWTYLTTNPAGPTAAPGPGWYVAFASPTPGSVITLSSDSGQQNLIDGGVGGGSPQANEFTSVPVAGSWPELPLPNWTPLSGSPAKTVGGVQLVPPITDFNGATFAPPYSIGALN